MGKADSLSRRLDWKIGVERDNENKILVKPEWLEVRRIEKVEIIIDGVTPYKCLDNKSNIFHYNNKNNQLERQV